MASCTLHHPTTNSTHPVPQVVVVALQAAWGGQTEAQTAARMNRMTASISGGIELK